MYGHTYGRSAIPGGSWDKKDGIPNSTDIDLSPRSSEGEGDGHLGDGG